MSTKVSKCAKCMGALKSFEGHLTHRAEGFHQELLQNVGHLIIGKLVGRLNGVPQVAPCNFL